MINIHDGQITDLLSNNLRYNPETIAIAYAVRQEKRRILALAERTRLMSAVDVLEERILDYLAVELRTPAYSDSFPIDVKRTLIKGTLPFYSKLGTPAAVDWVITAIFGNGNIEEWFEYGGEPHHFRVTVRNNGTFNTLQGLMDFLRLVSSIKRLSSWLDEIIVNTDPRERTLRFGGAMAAISRIPIPEMADTFNFEDTLRTGGGMAAIHRLPVPEMADTFNFEDTVRTGGQMAAIHRLPVPETQDTFDFNGTIRTGGGMAAIHRLPVPETQDTFSFDDTLHTGGQMAAVHHLPVPESKDTFSFEDTTHTGGRMTAVHSVPVPESQDTFSFKGELRSGGRMASIHAIPIPENASSTTPSCTGRVGVKGAVTVTIPLPEIP